MTTKVGLLFSMSGPTSIVEIGQYEAALLAIETINQNTSLCLEPVLADIKTDPAMAAKAAHDLLTDSSVGVVVGCYTSACRKAVLPVLEEARSSLIYPTIYEGEECHPRVFYCGAVPNQQVDPLLSWAIANISNQFILVGSDYVYPRTINRHVENFIEQAGGVVLLEKYFPLGCVNFEKFLLQSKKMFNAGQPLVLFSTLVGTSVPAFYKQYRKRGFTVPIFSPITSEVEFSIMGKEAAAGHYCSQSYFESLDIPANHSFVKKYHAKFGQKPVNSVMESTFDAVHLYANSLLNASARSRSQKNGTDLLRKGVDRFSFDAPQGKVMMDCRTQHAWQWSRIARSNDLGILEVIWSSSGPIPPRPYANLSDGLSSPAKPHEINDQDAFNSLIGNSIRFRDSVRIAKIAAQSSSNVLLVGETGTGKELFARAIHNASLRRSAPFVPVNCAAIPRDLIGSELFGYEGGAFTGSRREGMAGKIELANGGTFFLDEVGEMPLDLQVNLLRVLQDQEIYRIGGLKPIRVDVRIISATNRPILSEHERVGHFRDDLYYRLNVFSIEMPPLRNRKDDIPILANHFLQMLNVLNKAEKLFAAETMGILQAYSWPGNVRELQNAIERAFFVASDSMKILPNHLSDSFINIFRAGASTTPYTLTKVRSSSIQQQPDISAADAFPTLHDHEAMIIAETLSVVGSNISKAAQLLGISRSTLYRKMERHSICID